MKKLLMGIFGLMLLLPVGVNAKITNPGEITLDSTQEENSVEINVTVGGQSTVYDILIIWSNFVFEFTYDQENDEYLWTPAPTCLPINKEYVDYKELDFTNGYEIGPIYANSKIFKNNLCTEIATEYDSSVETYYYQKYEGYDESGAASIQILNRSSNKIQPSIEWDSTEEYLALDAKVWYLNYDTEICRPWTKEDEDTVKNFIAYTDSECTNYYDGYPRVEDGNYYIIDGTNPSNYTQIEMPDGIPQEIPDTGKIVLNNETSNASGYVLLFTLEGNPGHVVKYGDKIGKLTISIRAE